MSHCPRCGDAVRRAPACATQPPLERRPRERAAPSAVVRLLRGVELSLGAAAFLLVGYLLATQTGLLPERPIRSLGSGHLVAGTEFLIDPVRAASPPPVDEKLLDGYAITLRSGGHLDTPFEVRDPRPCTLAGRVQGVAGGGRDVEVYVLDESGYRDWRNGIHPDALFESGRASEATLSVALPRKGRYHLLLSNRYSVLTAKRVRIDEARLRCA